MSYSMNWDLESIYPNIDSVELEADLSKWEKQIPELGKAILSWYPDQDKPDYNTMKHLLDSLNKIQPEITEASMFISGTLSADVNNEKAKALMGRLSVLYSELSTTTVPFYKKFTLISDEEWQALLSLPEFEVFAFNLNEEREEAKQLLSEKEEALLSKLAVDGFQGWEQHYDTLVSKIELSVSDEDGNEHILSAGQAENRMYNHPDPKVRASLFSKWEKAWREQATLYADTLNHLAGFRLADYKIHNIDNFLEKPLKASRMQRETLDAMWQAISENKKPFTDYLFRKADLMGKDKLGWEDIEAPVTVGNSEPKSYPFNEGAAFIIDNFRKFSDKMADFAEMAFEKRWIEAEDRAGKAPGGYCAELPISKESRIFMTYSDSPGEVATLAHELGHAFHNHVIFDLPYLKQHFAMNVAETASTFAELVVSDATVKSATSAEDKIALLDTKIQNALAMFLNIHARFIFESNFYEERKKGLVSAGRLNELMEEAQKEAYQDSLTSYHPSFWASKLHFYISDISFYNFPYTFGYLFSLGIYAQALESGSDFEDQYIALLQDTGSMNTEDLARKHLDVDLTTTDFWVKGINILKEDIQTFMDLTERYVTK
ncbi:M3 family oligoendopeptidase [Marinilactibacillus psychrotolerans]|uniref:Oligoendopeptidase F n=1 Tax=Marinilactibacillus psychrotolerans TaxID=191770 RepID=A0AAV3WTB8_9LACT|nr:M3 family oligoendopeptidase [Marinilactibacillus psychrotolerans]GEL67798.1 oligoendopeptidase F [Marinilactibacillus psychrotolerans]GEQ36756.1 oligoendopeptidase F [Marinilactibacillus psychrotolerans]SDD19112.1 oligoendopeptidase, pepF/M3 family [Marinilactibacillus psychrotolerans]